jgi:hypothetical protein
MSKEVINLREEIVALQDIKGSLTLLRDAGANANEWSELSAYQMLTDDAFGRHIESLNSVVDKLKSYDKSGCNYQ